MHEGAVTTYAYAPNGRWMAVANAEATDTLRTIRGTTPSVEQITVRAGTRYVVNTRRDVPGSYTHVSGSWGYDVYHHLESDGSGRLRQIVDPMGGTTLARRDTGSTNIVILPSADSIVHGPSSTRYTGLSGRGPLSRTYVYSAHKEVLQRGASALEFHDYTYDSVGQIAGEWKYENGVLAEHSGFSFDATGNPVGSGATVSLGNRLEAVDGFTLTYDADGNLTRKSRVGIGLDQYLTWNSLGQLVAVRSTSNGGQSWTEASYGYDGSGRRVRQTVNGVVTRYVYDGQHVIAETNAAGNVVRQFTYYPGVDRPHSMRTGGQTFYYVTDHQGNVTGLVDGAGTLVNRYEYDAFGSATLVVEAVSNPLRFASGRFDAVTGFYANRARYYDPQIRRFISEDPLGPAGGINLYQYAGNNPLSLRDASGLNPCGYGERLVGGKCVVAQVFLLPTVCSCQNESWYEQWRAENAQSEQEQRKYMHERGMYYAPEDELRERAALDAVQSLRTVGDVGVGFVPGVSTLHDASVLFTGYNVITGESVGLGGRGIALVGAVTPLGGGQIRGGIKLGSHALDRMVERGVSSRMVEVAMQRGVRYFDPKYNTIAHVLDRGFASGKSLTVWFDPLTDSVTSVLRSSKNPIRPRYVPLP